jgi:hypothetical protein
MGDLIHLLVPYIIYSSATSDSGGGGAIQNVYPELLKLGMFDAEQSAINHCELHAMNKPLENALKKALGDSGIGHNSPWQLLYLSDIFLDQLVAELGLKRVNEIWAEINAQLFTDPQEATRILFCNAMRKMKKEGGAYICSVWVWCLSIVHRYMEVMETLPKPLL